MTIKSALHKILKGMLFTGEKERYIQLPELGKE
jgi:hypothetical protein